MNKGMSQFKKLWVKFETCLRVQKTANFPTLKTRQNHVFFLVHFKYIIFKYIYKYIFKGSMAEREIRLGVEWGRHKERSSIWWLTSPILNRQAWTSLKEVARNCIQSTTRVPGSQALRPLSALASGMSRKLDGTQRWNSYMEHGHPTGGMTHCTNPKSWFLYKKKKNYDT